MTLIVDCPKPTEVNSIPLVDCKFSFDQIQKFWFQRKQASTPFDNLAPITASANVTPFLAAADSTKIVVTPFVHSVEIAASEALQNGGNDNTTLNGIPEYNGEAPQLVTGMFKNLTAEQIAALRNLSDESLGELGIDVFTGYFVTKNGDIIAKKGATADDIEGISVYNIRTGGLSSAGFNTKNMSEFGFFVLPCWDEEFIQIRRADLDYNPLSLTN